MHSAFAAALLATTITAVPAGAQQPPKPPPAPVTVTLKPDVVILGNGDRLQGEIKALSKGRLEFDIPATGVIRIKWDHVVSLSSGRLFLVDTTDGTQVTGTLPPAGAGKLAVATTARDWEFDIGAVVRIVPIHRSFLQRLDGSMNLGGSYTQSSGVAQLSFAFNLKARRPAYEWRVAAEDYVTFESDGATTHRFRTSFGYSRDITGSWAVFTGTEVERNPDVGFQFRGTVGCGVERTWVRTNRNSLVTGAGVGVSREVPLDLGSRTLLPALLTVRHSFFTYSTPKTSVETSVNAFPILNQAGRWRLEASTSVSRELFKDFSVALTLYESYDNRPPSAEANRNDAGAALSIGFSF